MSAKAILFRQFPLLSLLFVTSAVWAVDWSSCASDLDDLRRAADDASTAANSVTTAQRQFDEAKEELENCLRYPQIYDLLRDRCQSKRWDYDSALSDLRSRLSSLQSELSDVESKARSVSSSCGYEISIGARPQPRLPPSAGQHCALYLRYSGRIPTPQLIEMCSKYYPENECRKCFVTQ